MQTPVMWRDTTGPSRSARTRTRVSCPDAPAVEPRRRATRTIEGRFTSSFLREDSSPSAGGVPAVEHDERAGEERGAVAGQVDVEIGNFLGGCDPADRVSIPEHGPKRLRIAGRL